jgi:two-component system, chemotaxis family, CheB/CheR fusion protein
MLQHSPAESASPGAEVSDPPPSPLAEPRAAAEGRDSPPGSPLKLVGIGASAGGVRALQSFFTDVPADSDIVFVVIIHLSPDHESQLAEVLRTHTSLPVEQVRGRTPLLPGHIYVIPPDRALRLVDGHVEPHAFEEERGRRAPIDIFFRTLASHHPDSMGVLLSGSGSDGVIGLRSIREADGVILVQSPDEAEYESMPRNALAAGIVDITLPARELGAKVVQLYAAGMPSRWLRRAQTLPTPDAAEQLRAILTQLRMATGRDFSGYKETTVLRRIARRMHVCEVSTLHEYQEVLQHSRAEAQALLRDLLISVTSFFRDPEAFAVFERDVVPKLVGGHNEEGPIRVWVPGCATGEEAYTIAMLLHERIAAAHSGHEPDTPRIQVFATDLDADAIAYARNGLYPAAIAADITEERLQRYFREEGAYYRVRRELRELVLFSPHDLLRDPPFSRLDLISCRNLLIYLQRQLQDRVFSVLRYALRAGGFLMLGGSEGVPAGIRGLDPVDKKQRIYRRTATPRSGAERLPFMPLSSDLLERRLQPSLQPAGSREPTTDATLHLKALETAAPPSILVDASRNVVHVSESAGRYLYFPPGSPTADLLKVALPELRLELRAALHASMENRTTVLTSWIPLVLDGKRRRVQLHVAPVAHSDETPLALVVILEAPVADDEQPAGPGAASTRRLQETESELDSTRSRMEQLIELSDLRHEELRTSNEELRSINEEYKSTLEELETSKEELHSTNEELKAVNDELRAKLELLTHANDDIRNLMASTDIGTLFLDCDLRIRRFTPALRSLFNVIAVDEGRPVMHVTHQLEYDGLADDCATVLKRLRPVEREISDRSGRHWLLRITPYRTDDERIAGVVATFTEITRIREAHERLRASEARYRALISATAEIVWAADAQGRVVSDSPSWREYTGQSEEEWLAGEWLECVHPDDRADAERDWREAVREETALETEFRLRHGASGEWRITLLRAVPVRDADGSLREWVAMNTDVTERRAAERTLVAAKEAAERAATARSQFLATMSHELRTPMTAVIGSADLLQTGAFGELTPQQTEQLRRITSSAWHLVAIVDEVLSYSRTEAGREVVTISVVDPDEMVRDIINLMELEAEAKGLRLSYSAPQRPVSATTDGGKFRQIVVNILGNAVKFTDAGEVAVRLDVTDSEIEVEVRDTGCGIPVERVEEMFEPFVQADGSSTRTKGGTGLGLTIARRLARLLGGDVTVVTEPGVGSTFTVRLPQQDSPDPVPSIVRGN